MARKHKPKYIVPDKFANAKPRFDIIGDFIAYHAEHLSATYDPGNPDIRAWVIDYLKCEGNDIDEHVVQEIVARLQESK